MLLFLSTSIGMSACDRFCTEPSTLPVRVCNRSFSESLIRRLATVPFQWLGIHHKTQAAYCSSSTGHIAVRLTTCRGSESRTYPHTARLHLFVGASPLHLFLTSILWGLGRERCMAFVASVTPALFVSHPDPVLRSRRIFSDADSDHDLRSSTPTPLRRRSNRRHTFVKERCLVPYLSLLPFDGIPKGAAVIQRSFAGVPTVF